MGQRYRQFDLEERIELARLRGEGQSIRQIATGLDRAPSSVARELKRNSGTNVGYKPAHADDQAKARRWIGSKLDRDAALRERVLAQLTAGWSPEQIAGRSRRDGQATIGVETIYRFIYAQITRHNDYRWRLYLPRAKFKRGRRGRKGGSPALHMRARVPLDQRPAEAADRCVPGHWEADLMAFARYGQNALMLHERTSRVLWGDRLTSKRAAPVAAALVEVLAPLPEPLRKTVTFDNGTEFAEHPQLNAVGIQTFFCDPHAPWQKGGIENAIGRMRRPLPRKTDLASLDDASFQAAITAYNNTPRKCLDWLTPAEAFSAQLLHFERESTSPLSCLVAGDWLDGLGVELGVAFVRERLARMDLKLHANASTTPRKRAYIQSSTASVAVLAAELGVSETTIRRWRGRSSVADRSHTPHRLAISLSPLEERLVVELRHSLSLGLDELVEVMHRCCNPGLTRSAIHRCLKRHGISRRPPVAKPAAQPFQVAEVGFIHIDLKHLTRLAGRPSYVFVAIDRATRFVHIDIIASRDAATVAGCLERFLVAFPYQVHTILTDNGSEFTDRFGGARWHGGQPPSGRHLFDQVCRRHGIDHRLTRPYHPQTNGMVERFNRRLAEALRNHPASGNAGKNRFTSHDQRDAFLHAVVDSYNKTRLRSLNYKAPAELIANPPGHNTKAGMTLWVIESSFAGVATTYLKPPNHHRISPPHLAV